MNSILGTWRLVAERGWDETGAPHPPIFGPAPFGLASFNAAGRMMAVLSDGRSGPVEGRAYASYCGEYTFDGARLVTQVDGASESRFFESAQIREVRFENGLMILRPPPRRIGAHEISRELSWERIAE
jgi:hypothetical protein